MERTTRERQGFDRCTRETQSGGDAEEEKIYKR
jgi:hypothetical protein